MTDTPELVRRLWGLGHAVVQPLGGGMNSETWLVEHAGATYVAKRVAASELDELVAGCEAATLLADAGFVTGRPVPSIEGSLVVSRHALALLEHVPGRELEGETDDEQRWIASTLAGVHAAGGPADGPSTATFAADWLTPDEPAIAQHPWLASAIEAVRAETDSLTVTWSLLHTDPSPGAFIHDDRTGRTGLIDWTGAKRGPVLYDVSSAVMYLGGPDHAAAFLSEYGSSGPLEPDELQLLDAFRRFRWVVQGAYFAWRLSDGNLIGVAGQADNEKGLHDARRGLGRLGLDTA